MPRNYDDTSSPNPKTFYRSREDKVIAGICGGLADRFGWDVTVVRIVAVVSMFIGLPTFLAYLIAWVIVPKRPLGQRPLSREEDAFWRGVSDRPNVTFGNLKYTFMELEQRLQSLERNVTDDEWRLRKQFRDLERG